jgi:tRNA splicing endonuclease
VVRRHFEKKGYRVHSGLQFGCELVLYADDPSKVHSDFGVHVVPEGMSVCCITSRSVGSTCLILQ